MKIFRLSLSNMLARPLSTILSLMLLALGVGMVFFTLQINRHVQGEMTKNIKGIDMVIGAKGSPLQLILSAIYHIDAPTGNIPLSEVENVLKNRFINYGVPLSYGDSHEGYRIVGTNHQYVELYNASISKGRLWLQPFEVTLGSTVSERLNLKIGDTFRGAHGLTDGGKIHEDHSYQVVGVLNYSNSVVDKLILTSSESVWEVHEEHDDEHGEHDDDEHDDEHDEHDDSERVLHDHDDNYTHDHHHDHEPEREITAILIGFRNPIAFLQVPRMINEKTTMQAAVPAYEIDRLFGLMGVSMAVIKYIAIAIMVVSGLSIFISLFSSLKERKSELALMRTHGASRWQLLFVILFEGLVLAGLGFLLGVIFGKLGLWSISVLMESSYQYLFSLWSWTLQEWLLFASTMLIGFLASVFPALSAFRLNISTTLADA